jgi:hypothetical protein
MPASHAHALVLDRLLAGKGLPEKSRALLTGLGARLQRACDLDPAAAPGAVRPTGFSQLDRLLAGGLPRGAVLELTGRRTSGRFSVAFAALAATTSAGEPAAFVDLGDHFDPQAAADAGADLERVLLVRPYRVKQALAASEMLLAAGFPLVVADLGFSPRGTRYIPDAAWVRLARSAQATGASLLLLSPWRVSGIAAEAVVTAPAGRPVWEGSGREPRLLSALAARFHLEKLGHATPDASAEVTLRPADALPVVRSRETENGKRETSASARARLTRDPRQAGDPVESRVEAEDARDLAPLHDGHVQRVPRGHIAGSGEDRLRLLDVGDLDRKDLVHDPQDGVEGGLNRVASADRDITMEDFLEDLRARDETFLVGEQAFEDLLGVPLMRMRGAHEVHRDVRVEEDHRVLST